MKVSWKLPLGGAKAINGGIKMAKRSNGKELAHTTVVVALTNKIQSKYNIQLYINNFKNNNLIKINT